MEKHQWRLLAEIGGEPLDGSGFEDETPASDEQFEPENERQEDEQ